MLDGHFKANQDRFWDRIGVQVARTGITANQITIAGTLLVALHCLAFAFHGHALFFAVGLALLELSDDLDGAVARVTDTRTALGAYLDAATDRYKDVMAVAAVAFVHDAWLLGFAAVTGGLLTSYHKARAGMERPIDNDAWPDLFERFERVAVLCVGMALSHFWEGPRWWDLSLPALTLATIATFSHLSALQRMARATKLLRQPGDR